MKLENQVCSLELAKKLKELGAEQDSLFYWTELHDGDEWANDGNEPRIFNEKLGSYIQSSAFTVAELGEMLPVGRKSYRYTDFDNNGAKWICEQAGHIEEADTEADARAKMLIYLIESKLIK